MKPPRRQKRPPHFSHLKESTGLMGITAPTTAPSDFQEHLANLEKAGLLRDKIGTT